MNRKILFSPLGGTDPISQSNYKDGSMLHICRFEKPDKVILYLSREMVRYEESDHRYSYCLKKLMELQNRTFDVEMILRPDLVDVHDYDFFYPEFSEIIGNIMKEEMDESDTLLLNIASGTPAMKSALAVLRTISEVPCRLVQVTTPNKSINKHDNSGYDPELLWECNEDNNPDTDNRCHEVSLPSLALMKKAEMIKRHVSAYDYRAALSVADSMPANVSACYLNALKFAVARVNYNLKKVREINKNEIFRLPVQSSNACKRFEYALLLQIKLKRGEYADFIRALTPLIVDLFEQVLKVKCGVSVDKYCTVYVKKESDARYALKLNKGSNTSKNKKNGVVRRWDRGKLAGSKILRILENSLEGEFKYGPVYSIHLKILIDRLAADEGVKKLVESLRYVEENVRNLAAHELDSFDEDRIKELTGQSSDAIMMNIRKLFSYTGYNIPEDAWDSYEKMNDMIIEKI